MNDKSTFTKLRKILVNAEVDNETFAKLCSAYHRAYLCTRLMNYWTEQGDYDRADKLKRDVESEIATITVLGLP